MNYYEIGQYHFNICFGEEGLSIKAINYKSLTDYKCDIPVYISDEYRLIPSLEILYQMYVDAFTNKNKNTIQLNIEYDNKKDEIILELEIKSPYLQECFDVKLLTVKEITNQQTVNNKLQYFNKRLTELENEEKRITLLENMSNELNKRLDKLEFYQNTNPTIIISNGFSQSQQHIFVISHCKSFYIDNDNLKIIYINREVVIRINNEFTLGYYLSFINLLSELETIELHGNRVNIQNLNCISKCTKLQSVTLSGIENLSDISVLSNFPNLKKVTLCHNKKIKNLNILKLCKNLEKLFIDKHTNLGIFSQDIHFEIEIM